MGDLGEESENDSPGDGSQAESGETDTGDDGEVTLEDAVRKVIKEFTDQGEEDNGTNYVKEEDVGAGQPFGEPAGGKGGGEREPVSGGYAKGSGWK